MVEAVSERYPREVIKVAQYLGAQLEKDAFFPPWRIQKLYEQDRLTAHKCDGNQWYVAVELPNGKKKEIRVLIAT